MKLQPLRLNIPVIYVNPPISGDTRLVEAVSAAGGLGFVDRVTTGPDGSSLSPAGAHGLRIHVTDLTRVERSSELKALLVPLADREEVARLSEGELSRAPAPVLVEVGSAADARAAAAAGAAGLVARGHEGPGRISPRSGLVLLQEVLNVTELPVYLQGGVSLETARGAVAAGAAGVVLDVHLLFTEESGLEPELKKILGLLAHPATLTIGEAWERPYRVYSRIATKMVRELKKVEDALTEDEVPVFLSRIEKAMAAPCRGNPDVEDVLVPLSEDIIPARLLAEEHKTAAAVVNAFAEALASDRETWPFPEGSTVCRSHGTRFPVVQGPMAHVSDNADFLAEVARSGALPFLAMGNMPPPIAKENMEAAHEKTGGCFGVGLIGLEVNRACYEAHLEIMSNNPPPFAILAAGSVDLAQRIEQMGTICYLHCPSPSILDEGLKAGLRHFVFEGAESGGHIGSLGSLDLWGANLRTLAHAAHSGLDLSEVTVLLAGGIGSARASAFVAGMVQDLTAKGLNVGLQMGTAYLATEEAVATRAVTGTYRDLTIRSDGTVVIGRTVNTKARAAGTPMAARIIEREMERIRKGVSLTDRKKLYERDNLGALRLASKGCAIDPETATSECPVFFDLSEEEQLERGLYLMGQVVSLLDRPRTMVELHEEIVEEGRRIFESNRPARNGQPKQPVPASVVSETPSPMEVEESREPIAVVGIGLRMPGSDSPAAFWEQIVGKISGIREVPEGRWENPHYFYDPDPKCPDKTYSKIGGFIVDFVFDPLEYRIPPSVAKKMDRTQQMAVACVADALRDAGLSPADLKGARVGIILGNSMGGETTDRYAERVALPRTLARLEEAFKAAGLEEDRREQLIEEFKKRYLEGLPDITEDSLPGELANVISGRVANVFNLHGPNFTVDAACASSMAAVMNAVTSLRNGTIDFAVTGGVDAAMHPSSFVKFCKIGALSPDGSRPFDEGANGFVMGEGAGVLILKRLTDAVRDGDRVYATILDIGSSSDGRGKGITAPNASGQERAVKACLESAGVPVETIGLIEAHGTSTAVGDETELTVLDTVFRKAGLKPGSVGLGSVKSQIGHLKAAAGAAGMIKAILSLYHKTLPPTMNVTRPNPCIDWNSSPLFLVTDPKPWETPNGVPRRAGVSAFGFGGTNFHVLLQEHVPELRVIQGRKSTDVSVARLDATAHAAGVPALRVVERVEFRPPQWPSPPDMSSSGEAWVIAGRDDSDLRAKIESLLRELSDGNADRLAASCRSEAQDGPVRCGFAAANAEEARTRLELVRDGIDDPKKRAFFSARGIHFSDGTVDRLARGVAFLFPGQGSQYPYMLRDLAERYPIVAETLAEADEILVSVGSRPVTETIFPASPDISGNGGKPDTVKETQLLQPMILAVNTALFRLMEQFGIKPSVCAGHSLGEYAACVAAGVFSFRDGMEAVAVRGREMSRVSIDDPGLMMSIPADARLVEEVLNEVDGYVVAANKNSPRQTVISGETAAVKQAGELFKKRGLDGVLLPVSAAFHSGVVAPAREPFMKTLKRLTVNQPSVPVISNVTGDYYPVGPAATDNIRELLERQFAAPVEWVKTLRKMHGEGVRVFLEIGPKRVLTNLALDTLPKDVIALPTNHPKKGGIIQLMETLAALAAEGLPIQWERPTTPQPQVETVQRPVLELVPPRTPDTARAQEKPAEREPNPLEPLLDDELAGMAKDAEFARYLQLQGEPIRSLIKSGFKTYRENILPMEKTVREVESAGIDLNPVVVSGLAAGLPSDVRFPFDRENLDDLIMGRNFIKKVPEDRKKRMLEKNIERLVKGPDGEAELRVVEDTSGVIQLAGYFPEEEIASHYGLDERIAEAMDITTKLAVAAGIEALKDAGIPLVRQTRTTSTGRELPDSWALPEPLRAETGVIFAAAFSGLASLVEHVSRETASRYDAGAKRRLIEFYTGLVSRIREDGEREAITRWFTEEFSRLNPLDSDELYTFNRNFLLRVMALGSGQLAQFIKAQGPNTHVDAACASTTQAVLLAKDWIRTGQAKRVLVVAADDVAGSTLFPWIGSGFLAMGAATTNASIDEAALPFDDRREGLILGSAAVGIVLEKEHLVEERGMEPVVSVETGAVANSAYHGTRLDVNHIASLMDEMVSKWEELTGKSRDELAEDVFFMSHETYSPKRGGSAAAEVQALRKTFGEKAKLIPITNTKGFTGHTMAAGVEDVVAMRCLQKGIIPPIANLKRPDPEFADLNLSRGGKCDATHVLRLAAGFGSQIVMAIYKLRSREENRVTDLHQHRTWLKNVTGYKDPLVSVEERTLRVLERPAEETAPAAVSESTSESGEIPAVQTGGNDAVREKILSLLSEKTGYPADMLDTDLDLEADLGIDTVKQAEFISEVREAFGIPRIEGLKIADFPTIEHIIGFVVEQSGAAAPAADEVAVAANDTADGSDAVREKILSLLSEKTGYPADMLDTDLDLEADLGIDTVKQAEFISEVREAFGIPRIEGLKIADFPTIEHIIGFVMERSAAAEPQAAAKEEPGTANSPAGPAKEEEIRIHQVRRVALPPLKAVPRPEVDRCLIFGGPEETAAEVDRLFTEASYGKVQRISDPVLPEDLGPDEQVGVINLFALESDEAAVKKTFELYRLTARSLEHGPAFLVAAVSEDGAYGFERPATDAHILGGVAGATKAFAREYTDSRARVLDLHPAMDAAARADVVLRSLEEEFPLEAGVSADGTLSAIRVVPSTVRVKESAVGTDDVILVTGGGRGIMTECLKRLVDGRTPTLVILGRTVLTKRAEKLADFGPEDWKNERDKVIERLKREGETLTPVKVERELDRLKAEAAVFNTVRDLRLMGAEVIYRSADVRDTAAVDAVVEEVGELCGRVDLVFHAAGIDSSRALAGKTLEEMERVYSVKIDGMRNLLAALDRHGLQPRRIVGFGSVSGRFGNMAQVDYSAANDGLSHLLRRVAAETETTAYTIDWAPWSDIGMAVRGSVQQTLEAAGIDFVPPSTGAALLEQVLAYPADESCEVVVCGRVGPFAEDAFRIPSGDLPEETTLAGQKAQVRFVIPGEYLRASVTLDPGHVLLDHHRIDRAAVLPGVGGMEIMRGAAALVDDSLVNPAFEDLRFHSPLKIFNDKPFEAEVEVIRERDDSTGGPAFYARIFSWFVDREGRKAGAPRLHHECRLLPSAGDAEIPAADPKRWDSTVWIAEADIYSIFFHGPGFRFLDSVAVASDGDAVRFRYRETEQRPAMFSDMVPPAVEAAFQAAAALMVESRGFMALPTGIRSVQVLPGGMEPDHGELFVTGEHSWEAAGGRKVVTLDAVIRDSGGNPVLIVKGIEGAELASSDGFPHRVFQECVDVEEIAGKVEADSEGFIACVLTPAEVGEFAGKRVPKRAKEWLAGRVALKRSIGRMLIASDRGEYGENSIEIRQDDQGRPLAHIGDREEVRSGRLSLSHSNGLALAAASDGDHVEGIGIDVENVEPRSESWISDYFTEDEIRAAGSDESRWLVLTKIWCLKEAALKALGTGLAFDLKEIEASKITPGGRAVLQFRGEAARYLEETGMGTLEARVEEIDGTVKALVLGRRRTG